MATSVSPRPTPTPPSDEELSQTEVFEILGNDRRRHALHYLLSQEDGTDIRELSRQLAAWENDIPLEEVTSNERRRVYVSLHQTHLPRMDDAGVLNYESSGDTIRLTERGRNLRVYMEVVQGNDIPWSEFYLGLSAFTGALIVAAWFDIPPFTVLPDLGWAVLCVGMFAAASAVHVYFNHKRRLGSEGKPPDIR